MREYHPVRRTSYAALSGLKPAHNFEQVEDRLAATLQTPILAANHITILDGK